MKMMVILVKLATIILSITVIHSYAFALPAFPGAEGFGSDTVGGRGGKVFQITNLHDSGSGSLRECVEASGARMCTFTTGGTIILSSSLTIQNPYITIAGQTAPGGGVTLRNGNLNVQTHDVVIRYLTVRRGPGGSNGAVFISKNNSTDVYNIIVDHCSMSWATDQTVGWGAKSNRSSDSPIYLISRSDQRLRP